MKRLGPLLAATDFSAPARHAAQRAARLAYETGEPLTIVHIQPGGTLQELREWLGEGNSAEKQLSEASQRELHELATDISMRLNTHVRTVCVAGSVLDKLVAEADAMQAGLIVLGARGSGLLRRLVLGSTCERLLRRTVRPVLVVRQTPQVPYRRVMVAVDFSRWSVHALAAARQVAPHAEWVLFHAYEIPFEGKLRFAGVDSDTIDRYRRQARTEAARRIHVLAAASGLPSGSWQPCIVEGHASLRIIEQEQALDCDLVVIGKHGQSAAEDLLLGSVTKHVLTEGRGDVLISTAQQA